MAEEAKHLETARADRSVWLMKCPTVVSRAWQEAAAAAASSSEAGGANPNPNPNPVVAKVVLSLDPLRSDDQSLQFKMEMAQTDNGNTPKSYSLNMFKDFVPMCVFSESNQEKLACEGKVEHKFDMEPHRENLVDYGKLCRERTKKSMVKTRKVQVKSFKMVLPHLSVSHLSMVLALMLFSEIGISVSYLTYFCSQQLPIWQKTFLEYVFKIMTTQIIRNLITRVMMGIHWVPKRSVAT